MPQQRYCGRRRAALGVSAGRLLYVLEVFQKAFKCAATHRAHPFSLRRKGEFRLGFVARLLLRALTPFSTAISSSYRVALYGPCIGTVYLPPYSPNVFF